MTSFSSHDAKQRLGAVRIALLLTWAGMLSERLFHSLWPLLSVVMLVMAALMLGLQDLVTVEMVWAVAVLSGLALLSALGFAIWRFRVPSRAEALAKLDETLPGRPLQTLLDDQAMGASDPASVALWRAHQARMAKRAAKAEAVRPNLRISDRDPYALRYVALLFLAVALVFGSIWRVGTVAEMTPGGGGLAEGPIWEGWAESPRYTGRPTIYLNDIPEGLLRVPVGSLITLRFYGELGALTLSETVSGRTDVPPASEPAQEFIVTRSGNLTINGPGGRNWALEVIEDQPPEIAILNSPEASGLGEMTLPYTARDDYGVEAGEAVFTLDLSRVTRVHGLLVAPEPRPDLIVPLPLPIAQDRRSFEENLIEDFSEHPWANLPVLVSLSALDGSEQQFRTDPYPILLPGRRFFDPLAAAVIEQRRDLLWSRTNAERISQILRTVSYLPDDVFRKEIDSLRLKRMIRRLEFLSRHGITEAARDQLAQDLWELALILEEGDLADAAERMRRAQDRLNEAIKNGASEEEIAELMRELRRATEDYLNQLSRQALEQEEDDERQPGQSQNSIQMTQDDLQRMMDRIQELMEEGRMAEAQEALRQLQEMLENMRVTQGQQGQGGQSPGEQAMEGLSETLREQQGLSDQAFRDLQESYNPNAQAGENQGNEGQSGGQGRGQSHQGSRGQGKNGEGPGDPNQPGDGQADGTGEPSRETLADRQQALRDELRRQQGSLPGAGSPEGDAARDALDRAGRAMDRAEDNLRQDDLAGAIDDQAQAMEALREGIRSLGEMMAQEQNRQPGQGQQPSDQRADGRDPLGRDQNGQGALADHGPFADNDHAQGRARELLDEIRRRSSETARPDAERDYLRRLLDRF